MRLDGFQLTRIRMTQSGNLLFPKLPNEMTAFVRVLDGIYLTNILCAHKHTYTYSLTHTQIILDAYGIAMLGDHNNLLNSSLHVKPSRTTTISSM